MHAHRLLTGSLIASLSLASLAPMANAGNAYGHYKWRRDGGYQRVVYGTPQVFVHRESHGSSWGPAIVGFVGGLALGTLLNNNSSSHAYHGYAAAPPRECEPQASAYYYEDPYGGQRYASLDGYLSHSDGCDHPRVVEVIDSRQHRCVDTIRYSHGQWSHCDPRDYDNGDGYRSNGGWQGDQRYDSRGDDDRGWQDRSWDDR